MAMAQQYNSATTQYVCFLINWFPDGTLRLSKGESFGASSFPRSGHPILFSITQLYIEAMCPGRTVYG